MFFWLHITDPNYNIFFLGAFIQISWVEVPCSLCTQGNGGYWKEEHLEDSRLEKLKRQVLNIMTKPDTGNGTW